MFPDLTKKQHMYKHVSLAKLWISAKYLKNNASITQKKHILSFFFLYPGYMQLVSIFYHDTLPMSHYHKQMHLIFSAPTLEFSVPSEPFPSPPWVPVGAIFPPALPLSLPLKRGSELGPVTADHPPLLPHFRNSPSLVFGSLCWAPVVSEPAGGPVSASPAAWQQRNNWISMLEAIMYTLRCRGTKVLVLSHKCSFHSWTDINNR